MPHPHPSGPGQNIEPGCLCLIIAGPSTNPEIAGTQCTAIELKPAGFRFWSSRDQCEKMLLSPCWAIALSGGGAGLIEQHKLLRIDNHQPEADELSQVLPRLARKGAPLRRKGATS